MTKAGAVYVLDAHCSLFLHHVCQKASALTKLGKAIWHVSMFRKRPFDWNQRPFGQEREREGELRSVTTCGGGGSWSSLLSWHHIIGYRDFQEESEKGQGWCMLRGYKKREYNWCKAGDEEQIMRKSYRKRETWIGLKEN